MDIGNTVMAIVVAEHMNALLLVGAVSPENLDWRAGAVKVDTSGLVKLWASAVWGSRTGGIGGEPDPSMVRCSLSEG